MRKFLFRGKRVDNGEWVEGYLILKDDQAFIASYPYFTGKVHETSWLEFCFGGFITVDPETVGQFRGLTDKNGKKIFEGDIVIDPDFPETKYTVEFFEGAFVAKNDNREIFYLRDFLVFGESEIEVIGNVHDTPDLLEVKNEPV